MELSYHGASLLAPSRLPEIARSVEAGYTWWLEVDSLTSGSPGWTSKLTPRTYIVNGDLGDYEATGPLYVSHWADVAAGPSGGFFIGLKDGVDFEIALEGIGGAHIRCIHPFSLGRGRYNAEDIVSALLGSEAMRLSVMGTLGDYQRAGSRRFWDAMTGDGKARDRELQERLVSAFRGGLEAARGPIHLNKK